MLSIITKRATPPIVKEVKIREEKYRNLCYIQKYTGPRVTDANLDYEGSITVDEALKEEAYLLPYEMVQS